MSKVDYTLDEISRLAVRLDSAARLLRGDARYESKFKVKWEHGDKKGVLEVKAEGPKEALHEAQKILEKQGIPSWQLYMSASYA